MADDLGAADTNLGGYSKYHQTPNIVKLAKRGMYFTNAYTASPLCSPTRSSILSGQNPARTGLTAPTCHMPKVTLKATVKNNASPKDKAIGTESVSRLDTKHNTLGKVFKKAGYKTAHFGKWHLGKAPYSPLQHGFDIDIPNWPGPGPAGSYVAPWKFPNFKEKYPQEHIEDRMGDEIVSFLEQNKDKPFFINYWQFSVHGPFDAKKKLIDKYSKTRDLTNLQQSPTYAAMIESFDDNVGKVMDALDRLGLAKNTIVVFYSDNGGNMYNLVDGGTATSNAPFRGGKASMYEGGVRVPALFIWPGVVKENSTSEALIQSEDLYATLLEMAGLEVDKQQALDSISAVPALKGEAGSRQAVFTYFPHEPGVPDVLPPCTAVRQGNWKLFRVFNDGPNQEDRFELYNLKEDIGERQNLATQNPERVKELDALIEKFLINTKAVTPVKNPKYNPDFKVKNAGWQSVGSMKYSRTEAGMQLRMNGEFPAAIETYEKLSFPAGKYQLKFKMRSLSASGKAVIKCKTGRGYSDSYSADVKDDGLWHDFNIPLNSTEPITGIYLRPASSQGVVHINELQLLDEKGSTVKAWECTQAKKKAKKKSVKKK